MEKNATLYDLTQYTQGMVFQAAMQAYNANLTDDERTNQAQFPAIFQIRAGYAESPGWMMVQAAEFDPEPLSVERFRKRAVYAAPKLSLAILELLASEKLLDRKGEDYYLTDAGRELMAQRLQRRVLPFADFEPIPADDITQLVALIKRVIDASMEADDPPGIWCLAKSRNRAPDENVAPLAHFIQYCSDFNAIRDDAHMAAYGAHDPQDGVAGHVWEAFSHVANEQAQDASGLYDKLAYRGFYTEDWQNALDQLCERGWLEETGGSYSITPSGQAFRDQVEDQTNAYFYAPWSVLNDADYTRLTTLLQALHDSCADMLQG